MNRCLYNSTGSYGNYCGEHDRCFKGFTNPASKPCNRAFVKRLLPIVQLNKGKLTYKANYARAAMVLFSKMM
ncbi:hypothetical protein FE324_04975 [Dolosigranulum pigrum]|nr:hypothetical protein FE324_04975 [Dolosigranulum pigrum]